MAFIEDSPEIPIPRGPFWGIVTTREDPEMRGRVKATVPGLLDPESGWLQPVGWPGAGHLGGTYAPPQIGANVLVDFIQGDLDEGVYWPGPPAAPDGLTDIPPTPAAAGPAGAIKYHAFATPTFEIYVVEDGTVDRRLYIKNRYNDDYIEMNANDNTITLQATTALNLWATGLVDIRGGQVVIQGRPVVALKTEEPI